MAVTVKKVIYTRMMGFHLHQINLDQGTQILEIMMPEDAQVMSVFTKSGESPAVWVLTDPVNSVDKMRKFLLVAMSGHLDMDEPMYFVGTFEHAGWVYNLFELGELQP